MEEVWRRRAVALIAVMAFVACSGFLYQIVASGDVTGDLPGPLTVAKLQGRTLDSAAPSTGNTITWDGSKWLPAMFSWANLTGTVPAVSTFTNDSNYVTSSGSVAGWTGPDFFNIYLEAPVGGSGLAARTVSAAFANIGATTLVIDKVHCATDVGTLSLRLFTPSGDIITALTCAAGGASTTAIGATNLVTDTRVGYEISSLSGPPNTLLINVRIHR